MPYHQVAPPPSLSGLLSVERMGTFERLARQQSATALELYVLDVELSSAFMADLALAEVILRNAMNDQLSAYFGARWYRLDHLFDKRSRAAIKRAWRDGKCADDAPPGKLIAQLTLGFWVNLLDSGGRADQPPHDRKCSYDNLLWRPCLRLAFPHGTGKRSDQHTLAKRVHTLRNRVAHHEPVIGGIPIPGTRRRRTLPDAHHDILTLMGTIDPGLADWMHRHSRVPALLAATSEPAQGLP
ncbi:CAAX protease [Saccharomonospora azurea]|uniref:CAAX protease n=1 Tax=Saccharomonospora azurea TaxID=40988 RepID=UPI00331B5DAE